MKYYLAVLACLAGLVGGPAFAADAFGPETGGGIVYQLTPEQVARIQQDAAKRHELAAVAAGQDDQPAADSRSRQVHGETGFAIGSGGYRSVFGSALYPLGQDGFVAIAIEQSQFARPRGHRR